MAEEFDEKESLLRCRFDGRSGLRLRLSERVISACDLYVRSQQTEKEVNDCYLERLKNSTQNAIAMLLTFRLEDPT